MCAKVDNIWLQSNTIFAVIGESAAETSSPESANMAPNEEESPQPPSSPALKVERYSLLTLPHGAFC